MPFAVIKAVLRTRYHLLLTGLAAALLSVGWMSLAQAAHHSSGPVAKSLMHSASHTPKTRTAVSPLSRRAPSAASVREIPADVIHAIQAAQRKVQADPLVLLAIAWQESRFDPKARNRHSSARGLLQFTTTTWLTAIRDFGARHGLAHYASAIRTGDEGQLSIATPRLRRAILALRENPELEAILAAEQLARQRKTLEAQLGRKATPADLYVLHLLGLTGATEFLTHLAAEPNSSSLDVVGSVLKPNRGLFVHDGRTLSIAEAYEGIRATLNQQATQHAALFVDKRSPDNGTQQMAMD